MEGKKQVDKEQLRFWKKPTMMHPRSRTGQGEHLPLGY